MSNKAQVIHNLGPPNSMKWQDWPLSYPKVGEVRLRHTAIGVNFADTYHRAGISHPWPVSKPPVVIGFEGVGIIDEIGQDVKNFKIGDKVAYGIPHLEVILNLETILLINYYIYRLNLMIKK